MKHSISGLLKQCISVHINFIGNEIIVLDKVYKKIIVNKPMRHFVKQKHFNNYLFLKVQLMLMNTYTTINFSLYKIEVKKSL